MMSPNDPNDDATSSWVGALKIPSAADETPIVPPFPTIPLLTESLRRFESSEDHVRASWNSFAKEKLYMFFYNALAQI
jgi:hypothetical protein